MTSDLLVYLPSYGNLRQPHVDYAMSMVTKLSVQSPKLCPYWALSIFRWVTEDTPSVSMLAF